MNKQDSVDEVFGFCTPKELDVDKIEKYFKDLEQSVNKANKVLKYSDDKEVLYAIEGVVSELSWVNDDIHKLFEFYNVAQDLIAAYRSLAEDRMTEDETYEHKAILVRNKLEAVR